MLRDNDLTSLPREIGQLKQLRELHIEGNRLQVLPPEVGKTDLEYLRILGFTLFILHLLNSSIFAS